MTDDVIILKDFCERVFKPVKAARMLSALLLLQGQGRLSTRALAEKLEVSERTAHRDMESLCAAGIPLLAYRGVHGGWELQKGWKTQALGLEDSELQGLLMVQPNSLGEGRLMAAAQRAFDKLIAALPATSKDRARSIQERLYIDSEGWRMSSEDYSMLPTVQEALAKDKKLTFLYTRADGDKAQRTVDPLGLVCKQMVWYLVAQTQEGLRTYRISRMQDALVLAISFERPTSFNLALYWKQSTAALKEKRQTFLATVALSAESQKTIHRWWQTKELSTSGSWPMDWRLFTVAFESYRQAKFVILGLGAQAQLLDPEGLKDEIAQEIAGIYRGLAKKEGEGFS